MDLALLGVTALGFVGVYLMLPREKASLVKLGGLLGVLGLGGLFLYLVRTMAVATAAGGGAGAGGGGVPLPFYLFAAIMIGGSVGVICHPKPVYAALYFVLVTLAGAGVLVLLMAEFVAIVLVIVYAGAILVTYVFVIMLASQGTDSGGHRGAGPEYDRVASEPLVAVLVSFILIGTILQVLYPRPGTVITRPGEHNDPLMVASLQEAPAAGTAGDIATTTAPARQPGNMQVLGNSLYGRYMYSLELAGLLLTIALVGAVVIARKNEGPATLGSGNLPVE